MKTGWFNLSGGEHLQFSITTACYGTHVIGLSCTTFKTLMYYALSGQSFQTVLPFDSVSREDITNYIVQA